jgi:Zn-dependent protease with chaperone function
VYVDRVDADFRRKVSYYAFLPGGVLVMALSSYLISLIVPALPTHIGVGDVVFLSFVFFSLYAIGFLMLYTFFRRGGYPTSYRISDEGVEVVFNTRRLLFIPFSIIEEASLDSEGPSFRRFLVGGITSSDMTARKCERYVAIRTPSFIHYLSPSDPESFLSELNHHKVGAATLREQELLEATGQLQVPRMAYLRKLFLLLFIKVPIGQLLVTITLFEILVYSGYPQFAYLISASFLVTLPLMTYLFSQQIASQLLDSKECTSTKISSALASLSGKVKSQFPKVEIADPMVLGTNAFTTGPSPSRSTVILTENVQDLRSDEISAVLAHELGHMNNWHTLKLTLVNMTLTALLLSFPQPNALPLLLVAGLLAVSFITKIFELEADAFSAKIANPHSLSSALQRAGEEAAYRHYALDLTIRGKSRPMEDLRESFGLKRPRSRFRRLLLWVFSLHPPVYYRIAILNKRAVTGE